MNTWKHGTTNGYKNQSCRCRPCKDAWNTYVKLVYAAKKEQAPGSTLTSWWISTPQQGMTALVQKEHLKRMQLSKFGAGLGKPSEANESRS